MVTERKLDALRLNRVALKGSIIDRMQLSALGLHHVHPFSREPATILQYSADLSIHLDSGAFKEFEDWKLFRLGPNYDKIDGVIGRDILQKAKFLLDSP